ncbi:MAG: hypothetical protein QM730_23750 [Anaerolineales bacterium]
MNETVLRWEGRIGSLRGLAMVALILIVIFSIPAYLSFQTAMKNRAGSQPVTMSQLALGFVEKDQYISVSGVAAYELAYIEKEDGVKKALIYPLIDQKDGFIVFVRTTHVELENAPDADVTVSGMTSSSATDLQNLIEGDMADINSGGFKTISTLYVEAEQKPAQVTFSFLILAGMAFAALLSVGTFFFPATTFGPYPVQQIPPDAPLSKAIQATGNFQQVKSMQPLQFGRSKRKFVNSVANLFVMEDHTLGVYIHFVYTHRVYGIQVSKQETDWMVLVKPTQVVALEPGKVYGWRDRWALSVRYRDDKAKEQTVYIIFENVASQVNFVNYLREKGYAISSGQYPVTGGQAWA